MSITVSNTHTHTHTHTLAGVLDSAVSVVTETAVCSQPQLNCTAAK